MKHYIGIGLNYLPFIIWIRVTKKFAMNYGGMTKTSWGG